MPNDRVLPVLLRELDDMPREHITLINGLGTHRPQTEAELVRMLGQEIVDGYRVLQHDCWDQDNLAPLGRTSFGHEASVNRTYLEADVRILTGFIEPHLFAGFSGGPKAVLPAVASESLILDNHSAAMLANPKAIWGVTEGNPVQQEMLEVARMTRPTFLLNVTLNKERALTGVFAGEMEQAHRQGTALARQAAMAPVEEPFDIVITSNSGYPLDLNLYQAVKGMSAAAQIVKPGGAIIIAAECWDGVPDNGHYKEILHRAHSPQQLLDIVNAPGFRITDQWQGQIQALIQLHADVYVKNSYLSDNEIRRALFQPCSLHRGDAGATAGQIWPSRPRLRPARRPADHPLSRRNAVETKPQRAQSAQRGKKESPFSVSSVLSVVTFLYQRPPLHLFRDRHIEKPQDRRRQIEQRGRASRERAIAEQHAGHQRRV